VQEIRFKKNITFSADETVIDLAREEARKRNTTLNQLFRDWLEDLAARDKRRKIIENLSRRMDDYEAGGPFARDEMNRI